MGLPSNTKSRHGNKTFFSCWPLCQLSSDNTRNILDGVSVGEETRWVGFDLLEAEPGTGVSAVCQDTGGEWASQTSDRATNHGGIITDWKGIWKSDARGTRGTLDSLMDVSRCFGRRSVVSGHACEGDVLITVSAFRGALAFGLFVLT